MIGDGKLFNAEKTISKLLSEIEINSGVSVFINRKFYSYAIIQSENIVNCILNSTQGNRFYYNGIKFYVVDDGDEKPRIWFARPCQLHSLFE